MTDLDDQSSIKMKSSLQAKKQAYVKILEQPASKALRFRYECEGRSAGSIPGARSTFENKTYPSIQIMGYQGRAVVVVSCVTKDAPHKPHPHNLVGRERCKKGVCTLEVNHETMTVLFPNLGIQCVKKKDIEHSLCVREEIRVDPFRTGFSHRNEPTSIDLNVVRLCFQVFLEGDSPGKFSYPLAPVVSDPIHDKKAASELSITKLSDTVSYVDGGRKDIILLCEKVAKDDIEVRFFEDPGDWEAYADFQPSQVHKQHAIWFRTPRYKTFDVTEPVKVFVQLKRPSDGAVSEALPFELWPLDSEPKATKRKRQKMENPQQIIRTLQGNDVAGPSQSGATAMNKIDSKQPKTKTEPRESPSRFQPKWNIPVNLPFMLPANPFAMPANRPSDMLPANPPTMFPVTRPSSFPVTFPANPLPMRPAMLPANPFVTPPANPFVTPPANPPARRLANIPAHPPANPCADRPSTSASPALLPATVSVQQNQISNLDSGEIENMVHRAYDLQEITNPLPNLDSLSLSDIGPSNTTNASSKVINRAAGASSVMDVG